MTLKLKGLEVVYPLGCKQAEDGKIVVELTIEANSSHIIILREYESPSSYALSCKTHDRCLSDEELIYRVKNHEES